MKDLKIIAFSLMLRLLRVYSINYGALYRTTLKLQCRNILTFYDQLRLVRDAVTVIVDRSAVKCRG